MDEKAFYDVSDPPSLEECHEVMRNCPIVRMGKVKQGEAFKNGDVIPQSLCIGCRICTKYSKKISMK